MTKEKELVVPSACNEAAVGDMAKVVLMPGDPLRAKYIAETYLEDAVLVNGVRNMLGYTGYYKGKRLSVMGHGMGIPSIGLYADDLYTYYGVEAIIRVGSTGGLLPEVKMRDVVIAMSASTNSNYAHQFDFPGLLAPTADYDLLSRAADHAESLGVSAKVGPIFTSDTFTNARQDANARYRDMGMMAVDMETAGLYMLAAYKGKKALSILTVSDHIFTHEKLGVMERQESFHDMMEIALKTAWDFS